MDISQILAIASGLMLAVAYILYNWGILAGRTKPNLATWAIWAVIVLVSTSSYTIASGDWWMATIALVNSVLCICTFAMAFLMGESKKIDKADRMALCLGILAAVVWAIFHSAKSANLIVQVAIVVGFYPTWRGIWRGTAEERPLPWWLWSAAYVLALVVVIMRWKGEWVPLVYPINCIWLHASVAIFQKWCLKETSKVCRGSPKGAAVCRDLGLAPRRYRPPSTMV